MNKFNNKFLKDIQLKGAKITYDGFDFNPLISLENQEFSLQEDIIQIEISDYIIDVGWYPSLDIKGNFTVEVIRDYDWDNPLFIKKTNNLVVMKKYLQEAIDFVDSIE